MRSANTRTGGTSRYVTAAATSAKRRYSRTDLVSWIGGSVVTGKKTQIALSLEGICRMLRGQPLYPFEN
ncbi:hypothetical protein Mame01_47250 [Microbispora amethystogenes]|nr:hypothetical protein Mame01_47250 [Microbispora amethystogenes]